MLKMTIFLFFIGIIECFFSALRYKLLQKNKQLFCMIISYTNIFIWYFMLRAVIDNINNLYLIAVYAAGYSLGDMLAIRFDTYLSKLAALKGLKLKRKQPRKRKK